MTDEVNQNQSTPAERVLTQADIDKAAANARREGHEKGRQAAMEELQNQQRANAGMTPEQVEELVNKRAQDFQQQAAVQAYARGVAENYKTKRDADKGAYDDFDKVVDENDVLDYPHLVELAAELDNTADFMYELWSNPAKKHTLNQIAGRSKADAKKEALKISRSIKENRKAMEKASGQRQPLEQLNRTSTAADSGAVDGDMSWEQLKKAPWLRG